MLVPRLSLARELEPFSWTRWDALGMKHDLWIVPLIQLVYMIAPTLKMLESPVKVCLTSAVYVLLKMLGKWESSAYLLYVKTPRDQLASVSSLIAQIPSPEEEMRPVS